jgi:hypothetical protein
MRDTTVFKSKYLGLPHLLAAEGQKLPREFGRALHRVLDLFRLRLFPIGAGIFPQQRGMSCDHG